MDYFGWVLGVCLGVVAALGTAEFCARVFLRARKQYYVHVPGRTTVLGLIPALSSYLEPQVRVVINRDGERGAELVGTAADRLRLVVIGGSAAECQLLDQASSWPERMAVYLRDWGVAPLLGRSTVHVGNLSRSELTSGGARLIVTNLDRLGSDYDVAVLMIGMSDMLRWLRFGAPRHLARQTASDVFAVHPEGPFHWAPRTTALAEVARRIKGRLDRWRLPVHYRRNVGGSVLAMRSMKQNATNIFDDVRIPRTCSRSTAAT